MQVFESIMKYTPLPSPANYKQGRVTPHGGGPTERGAFLEVFDAIHMLGAHTVVKVRACDVSYTVTTTTAMARPVTNGLGAHTV